jgi:4-amino-4-deoxy-L-arabinose transferase-like glycosyltransferase
VSVRRTAVALGALFVLSFVGLGRDLWTPDEPREAEIGREMWLSPTVVPTLNGDVFVEKPPLYYWTVAGAFGLFGGPSVPVARAVSGVAGFLTLLLVFFWGRRDFSTEVGLAAAIGLATCEQFAVSSHWILIDPLLMLFTTASLYAAALLVRGAGGLGTAFVFYLALALAFWTKGPVGPVLVGAGLVAYAALERSLVPLRRIHPLVGIAVLVGATILFAALVDEESGARAVREWLWVNQVQRFVHPTDATGHDQPAYYYLTTLPVAVFPWWVPFVAVLRPSTWRPGTGPDPHRDKKIFLGALTLGMGLVLSASATKRGNYLLPLLPPLFLLLAVTVIDWLRGRAAQSLGGWAWRSQTLFVASFAIAPTALALAYFRNADPAALAFVAAAAASVAAAIAFARRNDHGKALTAIAFCALAAVPGLCVFAARADAAQKDMTPFVSWIGAQIPPSQPLYVLGEFDETIRGIVPFVTGRRAAAIELADLDTTRPLFVLVQGKEGSEGPSPGPRYELVRGERFGAGRYLALWQVAPQSLSEAEHGHRHLQ